MLKNLDKYLIIALGLFSIAWGLFWLYKPLFFLSGSQYNIFGEMASGKFAFNFEDSLIQWILLLARIFASFLLVRAGIGLIKFKSQAGSEFWMAMVLHLFFSSRGFITMVGWSGNENIFTFNIFFIFFAYIIFSWPKVAERFPHRSTKWKTNFPYITWGGKSIPLKIFSVPTYNLNNSFGVYILYMGKI